MHVPVFRNARSLALAGSIFASTALLSSAASAATETDVEAHNRQVVVVAFDRWAAGGNTFFSDVLAPDVIWTIKGSGPSAGRFQGRERFVEQAVRPFVSRLSSPVRPVNKQGWADGDHVLINWDGVGVARDGQAYNNSYAWIFHMQDGKAVEVTAFLDLVPYDDVLKRIPASE